MEDGDTQVNITSQNSKYEILGISANEFPQEVYKTELIEETE